MKHTEFLSVLLFFLTFEVFGQATLKYRISESDKGQDLIVLFAKLESTTSARFFYQRDWIDKRTIEAKYVGLTLSDFLNEIFNDTDFSFLEIQPDHIVILKDPEREIQRLNALELVKEKKVKIEQIKIGEPSNEVAKKVTIKGRVIDAKSGRPLSPVHVNIHPQINLVTGTDGEFVADLNSGKYLINFYMSGFEEKSLDMEVYSNNEIVISLDETTTQLEEILIEDQAIKETALSRVGEVHLTMRDIKLAPALMGEVDLVKQIQNLPGVTTVGEIASGFNVRGGSIDQNLILYDGLPVFNTSHAFGFLTAFNPDAVSDVTFNKGGIPAEFGGRTSSVLDIRSRDGDYSKWNGRASIGMITSGLILNGPLKVDKTALSVSVRSTYSNWLVRSLDTDYADLDKSSVFFYDGTLKFTHKVSERTKLSVTGYSSRDSFSLTADTTYQWSNFQTSSILNHEFSSSLNAEFIAGVSSYDYHVQDNNFRTASDLYYRITTALSKATFNYQTNSYHLKYGGELLFYHVNPGTLKPTSAESNAAHVKLGGQHSLETAAYLTVDKTLFNKLFVEGGIRLPLFVAYGSADIYSYDKSQPKDVATIKDTLHFGGFKTIKTYYGIEPRISARYMIDPTFSFKLGYNRMYQFLHLVTNTAAVTPVDIWQASGYHFKPQYADQISLGLFKDAVTKAISFSTEGFYKIQKNLLDFKDGAQLILNKHLETDLLQGKGHAYGIETAVTKNRGNLSGSINYTYSRSIRSFKGNTVNESINKGNPFPSNFDQPHVLNVAWKINLSRRHFFTGNFTYRTGRPVTVPISVFEFENTTVAYFSGRNQYRIPDYHRLDVALVIEGNHKRKKLGDGTWIFSIYNVYARKNPYTVFFKGSYNGVPKPYQLSIVGTIFPSISFNFKF